MRKFKIGYFAAIALSLSIVSLTGLSRAHAGPSAEVQTEVAKSGSLAESIVAYGTLDSKPSDTRSIILQHDGVVDDVFVHPGEVVDKDAELLKISATPLAVAQFSQVESGYALARKELQRIQRLRVSGLASNDQVSNAEKAFTDAQSQLRAQKEMGPSKGSITIRAPFAGVITSIVASPGDHITAGSVLVTIGGRSKLIAKLGLEPEDAMRLKKNAKLQLSFALDKRMMTSGILSSVGGMIDPQSRLVPAIASLNGNITPAPVLGSTIIAHIFLPAENGILLPRSAILEDAQGTYLFVNEEGKALRKNVRISVETDKSTLIASGILSGEVVIISGNAALDDEMPIHEAAK
ncbi:MAG: efflux RND transporter periplasmic adaptor subunit [Parvibaculaceae bacterium]